VIEKIDKKLQDHIANLCLRDKDFLKTVMYMVNPKDFQNSIFGIVLKLCFEFYVLAKDAPKQHFLEFLEEKTIFDNERKTLIINYVNRLYAEELPNSFYVIHSVRKFVKKQKLENAIYESASRLDTYDFDGIKQILMTELREDFSDTNYGVDFITNHKNIFEDMVKEESLMKMGLDHIDNVRGGFYRKEFVCILGGYKGCKSWSGIHIGTSALLQGLKVLHISHENTESESIERYDRHIMGLHSTKFKEGDFIPYYYFDENTNTVKMEHVSANRPISNSALRLQARKVIGRFGGRLYFKKYPMSSCTMDDIEALLDTLDVRENFRPDIIINDYADIMKHDSNKQTRDQLNEAFQAHKRIADERNVVVVTFSQANRQAINARKISIKDFAEDIRKAATADTIFSVCQTLEQKKKSIATFRVLLVRQGKSDWGCGIVQNLDFGHFCTQTFDIKYSGITVDSDGEDAHGD